MYITKVSKYYTLLFIFYINKTKPPCCHFTCTFVLYISIQISTYKISVGLRSSKYYEAERCRLLFIFIDQLNGQ